MSGRPGLRKWAAFKQARRNRFIDDLMFRRKIDWFNVWLAFLFILGCIAVIGWAIAHHNHCGC